MDTWPITLPQSFQKNGFTNTPNSGVIRSNMDTGAPKVRRRFTSVTDTWAGVMIMTSAEVTAFEDFFKTTIKYGSLRFNFPNQFNLLLTKEVRFLINGGSPYTIVPDGTTLDYRVQFSLEVF